jgi:hypothetical protein
VQKPQAEDVQLKKALELLRDKRAKQNQITKQRPERSGLLL